MSRSRRFAVSALFLTLMLAVACQASPGEIPPLPLGLVDDPAIDVANSPPPAPAVDVKFDRLSLEQGLSQSTVTAILQDAQGFMWFGTLDGLNRYDGYSFKVYKPHPTDPAALSDNAVSALFQDQAGALWVGTESGGLNRFDLDSETFTSYQHDPDDPESISSNAVRAIAEDRQGTLWIATQNGLNRFDGQSTVFEHLSNQISAVDPYLSNDVADLTFDSSGMLWLATSGGLLSLDPQSYAFGHHAVIPGRPPGIPEGPLPIAVNAVISSPADHLWLGTGAAGLIRYDPHSGRVAQYLNDPEDPTSLSHNAVYAVSRDNSGNIWAGTQLGLDLLEPGSSSFIRFQHDPLLPDGLSDNEIQSLFVDEAGVLWIGTRIAGLNKLDPYKAKFRHIRSTGDPLTGLSHPQVLAIHEDHLGYLWVGTGDGLTRLARQSGSIKYYFNDPGDNSSLSDDTVTSIIQDHTGALWVGTQGGLNRLDRLRGNFRRIQVDPDDPHGLGSDLINALYEDRSGHIWVGTAGAGLNRLDPPTGRFDHYVYADGELPPETLGFNHILSFYEDEDDDSILAQDKEATGILWIGTMGGLIRFDPEREALKYYRHDSENEGSLIHNQVNDIHRDGSGVLWLATGAGLDRYDPDTDSFSHFAGDEVLANNMILAILEDDAGRLWISHTSGLTRYDPRLGAVRSYETADGLQSLEFNRGARHRNSSGEMFFGGINGLNLFDPAGIHDNPYRPPLAITDLQILNESVPIGPESVLQKPIYRTESIALSDQEPVITFELAALHYGAPEEIQYAYLMQGFDRAWNYLGNRRYATYTNLPPGGYVFRAIGSNSDGVWNDQGVAIAVTIPRPYWQSLWFISLTALVVLAAVYTGYRLRSRSVAARTRELEEQVARRTAEIEKRRQIAEGLREILVLLNTKRSLAESLHYIVSQAARLTDAEDAIIFRLEKGRQMTIVATNPGGQIRYEPDAELLAIVEEWPSADASEREPLIMPSLDQYWLDHPAIHAWVMSSHRALMGIPLQFDDVTHGGLFMFYAEERDFTADDLELGRTFGDQATLAIANDSLRRQAEQTAIASERSRLARELHDAVTQTIFSASLLTETLEPIWEMDQDEGRKLLGELRQLTRGALAEMRTLLLELRPSALEDSSLSSLLGQLAEAVTGRTGVPVSAQMEKTRELPVNVRIALYRIAQESLNNVVKHARATRVSLTLCDCCDGNGVILTVKDNGRGFDQEQVPAGRLGLGIIRERAAAIDAQLSITSALQQGTTVKVIWTVDAEAEPGYDDER